MDQFLSTETIIIELLIIVSIVAIAVRRLRIPYTVALVVVGLIITFQTTLKFELTPQLILALLVPPLIFEAAFHLNIQELRRNLPAILLLAVPGVIITMFIVGIILVFGISLSLPFALLFGALISATDPVAVVALFRTLGVPKRLAILIEGESLFNDATAVVLFNLMLTVVLTSKVNLMSSIGNFVVISVGGIAVGLVVGWLIAQVIARVDNYLIETTLTTVLAFGSYLLADRLGLSGILAVLTAGLITGNTSQHSMSPTSRIIIFNFWEYIAFLSNSILFLLIGLQVNINALLGAWQPIAWAILGVFVARCIVVYGLCWVGKRVGEPIPLSWQHILNWGDLRGAICLALALSLPAALGAQADLLQAMTFGVVLFTLLVQSTTMAPLVKRLKIITRNDAQLEYELNHARLTALRSADLRLDRLHNDGMLSSHTWDRLKRGLTEQANSLAGKVRGLLLADPILEAQELETGWRELLRAQRAALLSLRHDSVISDEAFDQLVNEVDAQLSEGYAAQPGKTESRTQFIEVTLSETSGVVGKLISELDIPRSVVLVSIQRGDEVIIPRGDTILDARDVITLLCEREAIPDVKHLLIDAQVDGKLS